MREILKKYEWLFFVIIFVSLFQSLFVLMFLAINFYAAFNYILNGVFQYSEAQIRAIIVAALLQLPVIILWLIIFIISLRKNK